MFKNLEGKRIPDVTFRTRRDHEWVDVSSKDIFDGKNVIVFSLPGAFTPTCSSTSRRTSSAPAGRRSPCAATWATWPTCARPA